MIEAKIIADSMSPEGKRITTMQLTYPRFIHSEFMTHRVFSRNASSSRAIPIQKIIDDIRANPAMPIHWGQNQPGMQADSEVSDMTKDGAKGLWLAAMESAISHATVMAGMGIHKQIVNRLLEPFHHIRVIVTGTEWENFFELRDHPDAQPEIRELAIQMRHAMDNSVIRLIGPGEWHLPFIHHTELADQFFKIPSNVNMLPKISAARCCRVSYLKHDGSLPNIDDDLALFQRLAGSVPLHASPLEHQATPDDYFNTSTKFTNVWQNPKLHGNFSGWIQHRKLWEREMYENQNTVDVVGNLIGVNNGVNI